MKYLSLMFLVVSLAGCQGPKSSNVEEGPAEAQPAVVAQKSVKIEAKSAGREYHYSPFVVQVPQSKMVFDIITFKDVGLKRESKDPTDPVLESLAEAVAFEIQSQMPLGVTQSHVEYLEEYSDPANHKSCESQHLYVDVWNKGDEAWGYSLWSGCNDTDNFAWEEVPRTTVDVEDIPGQVQPLAGAIAKRLVAAHETQCFVKNC